MSNLPSTYEEFVWHFVSTLPKGFKRLDIVADNIGLTQSKVEKETLVVRVKVLSLHLLNQDSHMIFLNS